MGQPAIRTQIDELDEAYSIATALDCSDMPDLARQEFKDETDVNKILARYGVNAPMREAQYGLEVDYNLDLQQSLAAIYAAQDAIRKLPPDLRAKYPDWQTAMQGIYNGTLQKDLDAQKAADKARLEAEAAAAALNKTPTP